MAVQRGLVTRGNFPGTLNGTGTYFSDGLRVGPTWDTTAFAGISRTNIETRAIPQFTRWGGGVPLAPLCSYPIAPFPLADESEDIPYSADVCEILPGSTTGNQPLTVTEGSGYNASTTWFATCFGGEQGLQLDWPRAVQVRITGGIVAPISIHIFGYDWWGNAMQVKIEGIVSDGGGDVRVYSPVLRAIDFFAASSNKAFYQITRVRLTGNVPTGGGTGSVVVSTASCFGLPYKYTPHVSSFQNIMWQGASQIGGSPLDVIAGAQLTPADTLPATNTTGDVRGTFTPSTDPESGAVTNSLVFLYYVGGADRIHDNWADAGLPAYSIIPGPSQVSSLSERDLFGQSQYYTGLPA